MTQPRAALLLALVIVAAPIGAADRATAAQAAGGAASTSADPPPDVAALGAAAVARCAALDEAVAPWRAAVDVLVAQLPAGAAQGPVDPEAPTYPALHRAAEVALHARHGPAAALARATAAFVALERGANARRLVTPAVLGVASRFQAAARAFHAVDRRLMDALQRI